MDKINYKKIPLNELITYSQNQDINAIEELVKRIQKDIYTFLLHLGASENSISDLTQESLIKIIKNIDTLKNINFFKSWIKKITINIFYDTLRKQDKECKHVIHDNCYMDIESKYKPTDKFQTKELGNKIKTSIINLPLQSRVAIVLRELNGFSYEEIARLTNSNIGTVKSRISRAREKLQTELAMYL